MASPVDCAENDLGQCHGTSMPSLDDTQEEILRANLQKLTDAVLAMNPGTDSSALIALDTEIQEGLK